MFARIAIRVGYVSVPRFGEGTHLKLRMNNGHPTPTALGINNGQGMSRALTAGSPGDGSRGATRTARKLPAHRGALDRLQLAKIDPRRITGPYGRVAVSWPKPAPQRALLGRKTAKKENSRKRNQLGLRGFSEIRHRAENWHRGTPTDVAWLVAPTSSSAEPIRRSHR